jgi:hypothetical protein
MTEDEWLACGDPKPMFEFVQHKASDRKMRLFSCGCCRAAWYLLTDRRSRLAVRRLEEYADASSDDKRLKDIRNIANAAAVEAARLAGPLVGPSMAARAVFHAAAWARWCIVTAEEVMLAFEAASGTDRAAVQRLEAALFRDIFGSPFRPATVDPAWLTSTVFALAEGIYRDRAFDRMPILADALQDAGCDNEDILNHCRDTTLTHVRGCWAIDLLTGRE